MHGKHNNPLCIDRIVIYPGRFGEPAAAGPDGVNYHAPEDGICNYGWITMSHPTEPDSRNGLAPECWLVDIEEQPLAPYGHGSFLP